MSRFDTQIDELYDHDPAHPMAIRAKQAAANVRHQEYYITKVPAQKLIEAFESVWTHQLPELCQEIHYIRNKLAEGRILIRISADWGRYFYEVADLDRTIAILLFQSLFLYPDHLPDGRFISKTDGEWLQNPLSPLPQPPPLITADTQTILTNLETDHASLESFIDFCPGHDNPFNLPDEKDAIRALHVPHHQLKIKSLHLRYEIFSVVGQVDPLPWVRILRELPLIYLQQLWTFIRIKILLECPLTPHGNHRSMDDVFREKIANTTHRVRKVRELRAQGICLRPFSPTEAHVYVLREFQRVYNESPAPPALQQFFREMCVKHNVV